MLNITMSNGSTYEVRNEIISEYGIDGEYRVVPNGEWSQDIGLFPMKNGKHYEGKRDWYISRLEQC